MRLHPAKGDTEMCIVLTCPNNVFLPLVPFLAAHHPPPPPCFCGEPVCCGCGIGTPSQYLFGDARHFDIGHIRRHPAKGKGYIWRHPACRMLMESLGGSKG